MKTGLISIGMALVVATAFAEDKESKREMMKEHRAKMAEMADKMQSEWKAQDAELDKLVGAAKSAPPEKKAEALEAVVEKLVENRKSDHEKMEAFHQKMKERWQSKHGESAPPQGESSSPKPSL